MIADDPATKATIILMILDVISVAARFYSRWSMKAGFGWDDWTILIAVLTGIVPGALLIWANSEAPIAAAISSNFDPNYVFTPADIKFNKITFSTTMLYFFVTCLVKMSLLLLLHRVFAVDRSFKLQIYVVQAVVVAYWISITVANICSCIPLEWAWNNANANPLYCFNYNDFWLAAGICECFIDLVILVLPLIMVSKLRLDKTKKYGVGSVFLLGSFVLFSGVAKVILSYIPDSREPYFARAALWTTVHLYTGIICANMPTYRPFFTRAVRLGAVSLSKLSSRSKSWYGQSSGKASTDRDSAPRETLSDKTRPYEWPNVVEVGPSDCELGRSREDGQAANGSANLVALENSPPSQRE